MIGWFRSLIIKSVRQTRGLVYIVSFSFVLITLNCSKKNTEPIWSFTFSDVASIDNLNDKMDSINLDVYVDATLSMQGFAKNPNSFYNKFIEEIETAANTTWKNTNVKYFKFGTKLKEINRNEFLSARLPSFYTEKGIFEETRIDSVIDKTDISRLTIVLTDLFQTEADINSIVLQIKNRCFAQNIQLAVMGVESFYDGKVFDAKVPAYRFVSKQDDEKTFRPFYAIMFGEPENMLRLYNALKNKSFVNDENFILISKYLVDKFETKLTKSRESKALSIRKSENGPNTFEFNLKEKADEAKFEFELDYEKNKYTYQFEPLKLELKSFKKLVVKDQKRNSDSSYTNDIKLIELEYNDGKIKGVLDFHLSDGPGIYSYCTYLQLPQIGGYIVPDWVKEFSSENPNPKKDSNKTLNLEKFVNDLIQANNAVSLAKVGKFFITIRH